MIQRARAEDHAVLDRLCEHLIGPLDVRDYSIHSSSSSRGQGSLGARGSPSAHGSPGTRGSPSERDGSASICRADPKETTPLIVSVLLDFIVLDVYVSFSIKSTAAILDVFCYSLSPPFLGWQFCLVNIYDCLCCWLMGCLLIRSTLSFKGCTKCYLVHFLVIFKLQKFFT